VALLVEPTPFTHVSGYSNRFKEMLRFLVAGGDEAAVITPDDTPERPHEFLGVPITYVPGFRLIVYQSVQLTLDIGFKALHRLKEFKPDLIHVATPGVFVLPTILYARMLQVPLVISYHTHLSVRAPRALRISRRRAHLEPSEARLAAQLKLSPIQCRPQPPLAPAGLRGPLRDGPGPTTAGRLPDQSRPPDGAPHGMQGSVSCAARAGGGRVEAGARRGSTHAHA
jgi:hypothetical protein